MAMMACGGYDDIPPQVVKPKPDPVVPRPPVVQIIRPASPQIVLDSGNALYIVFKADTGTSTLSALRVLENGVPYQDQSAPLPDSVVFSAQSKFGTIDSVLVRPHGLSGDVSKFRLIISDAAGRTDTARLTVNIEKLYRNEFLFGVLDNPLKSTGFVAPGFNLVTNLRAFKFTSPSVLDMLNTSDVASSPPSNFIVGWESKNSTRFVVSPGFDYDNASVKNTSAAYLAGSAVSSVSGLAVGDIVIASLRNTGDYAVIKVTGVDTTSNDNEDRLLFHYKKK